MARSSAIELVETTDGQRAHPLEGARLPSYALGLLWSLQLTDPDPTFLRSLSEAEWSKLLRLADSNQLTLQFGYLCRPVLPAWVRARIDANYASAKQRFNRLEGALLEISDAFESSNIEFVLLKAHGYSRWFTPHPVLRAQGDIDLWCLPDQAPKARDLLLELGYVAQGVANARHFAPLIRPSKWCWQGDYFAAGLPIPVDLHYSLWNEREHRIPGPPEHDYWERRERIRIADRVLGVLSEPDTLGFAASHLLMHILAGDLRLQRAWELARFIHTRAHDEDLWRTWQKQQTPRSRIQQLVVFRLCADWFGARWPRSLADEEQALPDDVKLWIERYRMRPLEALLRPNKDELLLHLALLSSARDRVYVFARRLLPTQFHAIDARMLNWKFCFSRFVHHSRTLVPTVAGWMKWWWVRQGLSREFLLFQISSAFFDFGEFIFFLLFNLYLLDRGFDERFIGQAASTMTAGTIAGTFLTVMLARRVGLRGTLLAALLGAPVAGVLRTLAIGKLSVLASSLFMGMFMSIWAVSFAPVVSGTTNERNRALGFSLVSALGIGLGSVAGVLGGRLPGMLQHAMNGLAPVDAKRVALLIGSGIAALGAIPMMRLRLPNPEQEKRSYPRTKFIFRFCTALLVWSVATGAFNPFFNAYFAHQHRLKVGSIGVIFSTSQLATVAGVIFAPIVLKRMGQTRGISAMQAITGLALLCLAFHFSPLMAAALYICYMCFQYMSEPALFTLLMSRVRVGERSGASALNFLVISAAGTISALLSGAAISRFGYSFVLGAASLLAFAAALMFLLLVRDDKC
ncbi:MAG: nucleotidyltransferase family protein [Acidobacteriaceae bacterium]|nr:nucleotidyltransferase family protein [Acidobacteriaceae bacterium]